MDQQNKMRYHFEVPENIYMHPYPKDGGGGGGGDGGGVGGGGFCNTIELNH